MAESYPWPQALFFDLDGTLVDSVPDLAGAVDNMLRDLQFPPAGEDKVRLWVGNGSRKLVQRAVLDAVGVDVDLDLDLDLGKEKLDAAHQCFLHHYARTSSQKTRVYPHVREVLADFYARGVRMAVITNKPGQFTPHLLEALNMAGFFELLVCGDTLPTQKPDPAPLLYAMEKLSLVPEKCWMVGDSRNDIDAANAAGIDSVCVSYGYNHGEDTRLLSATVHITDFGQLQDLFGK